MAKKCMFLCDNKVSQRNEHENVKKFVSVSYKSASKYPLYRNDHLLISISFITRFPIYASRFLGALWYRGNLLLFSFYF
jgi:hypothetical protein